MNEENEIRKIVRDLVRCSWIDLQEEYKDIFPPTHMEKFENAGSGREPKYHIDQTLCLFRMSPINSEQDISMKRDTLNSIFDSIVSRIEK
jgi:hypothetical protein